MPSPGSTYGPNFNIDKPILTPDGLLDFGSNGLVQISSIATDHKAQGKKVIISDTDHHRPTPIFGPVPLLVDSSTKKRKLLSGEVSICNQPGQNKPARSQRKNKGAKGKRGDLKDGIDLIEVMVFDSPSLITPIRNGSSEGQPKS